MSARRRLELLAWAERNEALIFEDDYDSEFRYSGWPVPALAAHPGGKRIVTFGAFTKSLYPALRIGYVILPSALIPGFESALAVTARYPSPLLQQVLFDFIAQGHYARHIQRMRSLYAQRRETLVQALHSHFGARMRIDERRDGLALIGWLNGASAQKLARAAMERDLAIVTLGRYVIRHTRPEGLVLGFANAREPGLAAAMNKLEKAASSVG
jgi:GntR family transcriptional regulator / MocR family aminotransferase